MDVDGSWVFTQNIVGDVTYPELVSYCIVLFCQGMIRSISIPAGFWTFVDFEESDCFEHLELHKSGRPSLPRITICCNICTLGLSRRMPEDTHLGDHTLGRRAGRSAHLRTRRLELILSNIIPVSAADASKSIELRILKPLAVRSGS